MNAHKVVGGCIHTNHFPHLSLPSTPLYSASPICTREIVNDEDLDLLYPAVSDYPTVHAACNLSEARGYDEGQEEREEGGGVGEGHLLAVTGAGRRGWLLVGQLPGCLAARSRCGWHRHRRWRSRHGCWHSSSTGGRWRSWRSWCGGLLVVCLPSPAVAHRVLGLGGGCGSYGGLHSGADGCGCGAGSSGARQRWLG